MSGPCSSREGRGIISRVLRRFERANTRGHADSKPAAFEAPLRAVIARTWRAYPLVTVAVIGFIYLVQYLVAPPTSIPLGSTATMSFVQGPPVLVTVKSFSLTRPPGNDHVERKVRFYVEMRLRDPMTSMGSGEALASYCSVLSRNGVIYPADLSSSGREAAQGNFELSGPVPYEGWVVAYVQARVHPAGVTCQLGDEVDSWLLP